VNETLSTDSLPYPTVHMEGLFTRLRAELKQLRQLIGQRTISITMPMNGMTHERMFETVSGMFVNNDSALAFFLAYPTRRLSSVLLKAAADATAAVAWLAQNPPMDSGIAQPDKEYEACCERMQTDIADWRLSVDLKRAWLDLDVGAPETVH
jgi:hypothetical protein